MHPQFIHQSRHVVGKLFHGRDARGDIALTKTAPVKGNETKLPFLLQKRRHFSTPHAFVERKSMQEKERLPDAMIIIADVGIVDKCSH